MKFGHSVLKGRPWGGAGLLISSSLNRDIKYIKCKERFVLLVVANSIFINMYLPTDKTDDDFEKLISTLTEIESRIEFVCNNVLNHVNYNLVAGGDLNVNLDSHTRAALLIKEFMDNWL